MKKIVCGSEMFAGFIFILAFLSFAVQVFANMKEIKAYKEAFPDAKVTCVACHSVAMPKKGAARLNDYGQAVLKAEKNPTPEIFKKLGKVTIPCLLWR
jgi:hypothetical protein